MPKDYGSFVISLDFELHWGVRDHLTVDQYRENLLGVRRAIPELLTLFRRREIHATWATVGFLFAENRKQILDAMPSALPTYRDSKLSPYREVETMGEDEKSDPFHYAASLIREIAATPNQEIGTHTFSHYYCLEPGQSADHFDADLKAARAISREFGDVGKSMVMPRNQFNPAYLDVMKRNGVRVYRSNPSAWVYDTAPGSKETLPKRALRLADSYLPIFGDRTTSARASSVSDPKPLAASAFLRPFSTRWQRLDALKLKRMRDEMTHAAERGRQFHVWWHPHNFGVNLAANLRSLEGLLDHYDSLRRKHGMVSMTMGQAGEAS